MPIPKIFWLWVPLIWLVGQITIQIILPTDIILKIHAENSIHEMLQFLIISAACFVALYTLIKLDKKTVKWPILWLGLTALCCAYVAIEEISWGQSFFAWSTPEFWATLNQQGETNLHNTSRWLNQIPRYCLKAGIAIGGFIIPLFLIYKPNLLPQKFKVIYPTYHFSITALCLLFVALGNKVTKTFFDFKLFDRSSEIEEIYMFFFVLLYCFYMKNQFLKNTHA